MGDPDRTEMTPYAAVGDVIGAAEVEQEESLEEVVVACGVGMA